MDNSKLFGKDATEEELLKNDYRKYFGKKWIFTIMYQFVSMQGNVSEGILWYLKLGANPGLFQIMARSLLPNQ